jgi:hypothetical protein
MAQATLRQPENEVDRTAAAGRLSAARLDPRLFDDAVGTQGLGFDETRETRRVFRHGFGAECGQLVDDLAIF